ncbi:MAG: gliding motility-associated C-terminal domain-containing protein, partial [Bacteroidales bacterium]|nr:gliding motility-associated C-terminal domain-containing protein [Bacteroidales bacterium]
MANTSDDGPGNCTTTVSLGLPGATDVCEIDTVVTQIGGTNIDPATYVFPLGTTTVTWIATNIGGNSRSCTQLVTVSDDEPPIVNTVTGTLDVELQCSDATGIAAALALSPTATDNCTALPTINLISDVTTPDATCANAYVRIRTWNFSDNYGNTSANFTQTITIRDNTPPTFTRPIDVTIYTDASCSYDITVLNTGDVSDESDNCSTGLEATYVDAAPVAIAGCEGGYTIERTWSLIDNCGNAALDQIQTITIRDNTPPTFTRPIDVTIYTDASCSYDITVLNTGDVSDESDNCSTGLDATYVDAAPVAIAGCEGGYTIERTWSLIDNCGNAALDQIQTITIRDNTPPTFTRPIDVTIYTDASCSYDITVLNTGDVSDESDNCSTGLEATYVDAAPVAIAGCEGGYTIERTWSLIDNCGNAALDQIQTITIRDNTPPTFTRPIDVTIYTDASCSYDITVLNTGDVSDESDNCSTGLDATYVDAAPVAIAGCEGGYTIERTWSLIDNCGNA